MKPRAKSLLPPMEALSVEEIPEGNEWQYEPKWDGFRCIASRDGREIHLQSKSLQPLTRYFPELEMALLSLPATRFVLDGEIIISGEGDFSFDALLQRIHPAKSRVLRLSKETPAILIVFDLLAENGKSLLETPFKDRRKLLEKFASTCLAGQEAVRISPATTDIEVAQGWLGKTGLALDGIIAKRLDMPYTSGSREGMQKVKNFRSADCVVGGFRYAAKKPVVGSLLLGLYDEKGLLNHVGFTSAFAASERPALTRKLEKLIESPGFTGQAPGGPSRWNQGREREWQPLKPSLVVEVCYDHVSGQRFRHGTKILRWRPDKDPKQCTMDQLAQKAAKISSLLELGKPSRVRKSRS